MHNPPNCTDSNGGPASPRSADRIRSRFLHKIGIEAPTPSKAPLVLGASTFGPHCPNDPPFANGNFPILEPLKIALESDDDDDDDDSSFVSCDDDDDYENSSKAPINSPPDHCVTSNNSLDSSKKRDRDSSNVKIEYFRKRPNRGLYNPEHDQKIKSSSTPDSNAKTPYPIDLPLHDFSAHSFPSLTPSESPAQLSGSVSSNKKPRFVRNTPPKKKKGVTIHKTVAVVPIPNRLEYSNRIKESMWTTSAELATNATRNTIEFASEGWNWRNVIEDENMLVHQANGELIHPIHVHNALACASQASEDGSREDLSLNLSLIASLVPNTPAATNKKPTSENKNTDRDTNESSPSHAIA